MKAQPKQRSRFDFSAYGVVFVLECIIGRILVDGRTNAINIVSNNIYCCWKLLSAVLLSHKLSSQLYYCAAQADSLLKATNQQNKRGLVDTHLIHEHCI